MIFPVCGGSPLMTLERSRSFACRMLSSRCRFIARSFESGAPRCSPIQRSRRAAQPSCTRAVRLGSGWSFTSRSAKRMTISKRCAYRERGVASCVAGREVHPEGTIPSIRFGLSGRYRPHMMFGAGGRACGRSKERSRDGRQMKEKWRDASRVAPSVGPTPVTTAAWSCCRSGGSAARACGRATRGS
jgi:hypothetical protein